MSIDEALAHIRKGQGILFTGAGFSLGATNLAGEGFVTGQGFADKLALQCDLPPGLPLTDVSEEYAAQVGDDALIVKLQNEFTTANAAPHHISIARERWLRIYTTNYDDLVEFSSTQAGVHVRAVSLSEDIRDIPKQQALCIHLNGFVKRITRSSLWEEVKLTDASFSSQSVAESLWGTLFRQDLAKARCVVFMGWSLLDLDIKRVLSGTEDLKNKTFFVLGRGASAATVRRAERYGTVLLEDAKDFADRLTSLVVLPDTVDDAPFLSWRKVQATGTAEPLRDSAVLNLLMLGAVNQQHLYNSLHNGPHYVLERVWVARAADALKHGRRGTVVYSGLANGKSLVLQMIGQRAVELGFETFEYIGTSNDDKLEFDRILSSPNGRIAVLLDNYPGHFDIVKQFALSAPKGAALFLAARSTAHDLLVNDLAKILGDDFPEQDIDGLTDPEVDWFVDFLDQYGLWGTNASWHRSRKRSFITNDCQRQIRGVLLHAFEAPQVVDRLNSLMKEFGVRRDHREALVALLVLVALNFSVTVDDLMTLWDPVVVTHRTFRANPAVRELVSFESGRVQIRSAIAAEFILRKSVDANTISTVLFRLATNANKAGPVSTRYQEVLKGLLRYGAIADLVPDGDRKGVVFRYYENLRSIAYVRKSPLFWLQYGIAALAFDEFERSALNFKTAYSLAEKIGFDPYQIDNHYARLLLKRAATLRQPASCMKDFRDARRIVEAQMRDHRHLDFPYRAARFYREFWDNLVGILSPADKAEVEKAADFVLRRAEQLPPARRERRDVKECVKSLESLATEKGPAGT